MFFILFCFLKNVDHRHSSYLFRFFKWISFDFLYYFTFLNYLNNSITFYIHIYIHTFFVCVKEFGSEEFSRNLAVLNLEVLLCYVITAQL